MKIFYYLVVMAIVLNISGCLGDDPVSSGSANKAPSTFTIEVEEESITDRSAKITWTESVDPENTQVTYNVYFQNELLAEGITVLEYTYQNLPFNSEFKATVIANDADGGFVRKQSNTIVLVPNLTPTDFTITLDDKDSNEASFSWTPSIDPEGADVLYALYYRANINNGGENPRILLEDAYAGTSYQLTGLSSNTAYQFIVIAYDEDLRATEEKYEFSTVLNQKPDITVFDVTTSNLTSTSISLSWVAATDPEGKNILYKLYFDNINGTPVATTSSTSFNLTGLTPNQSYTLIVVAEDEGGQVSSYAPETFDTRSPNPPNTVTGFQASEAYPTSIKLTWNPTSDPDAGDTFKYEIYQKRTTSPFNYFQLVTLESTTTHYWFNPISKPNTNTTYSFKIIAVDASGNKSAEVLLDASTTSGPLSNFDVLSGFEQVGTNIFYFEVNENSPITKITFPTGLEATAATDNSFFSQEVDAFRRPGSTRVYITFSQAVLDGLKASSNKTATIFYDLGGSTNLTKTVDFSIIQ